MRRFRTFTASLRELRDWLVAEGVTQVAMEATGGPPPQCLFRRLPGRVAARRLDQVTARGSCIIYGRSDSTLNRGGIRMGTTDFYAVVEGFDHSADSLVIDTSRLGAADEGEPLCFLVPPGQKGSLRNVSPTTRAPFSRP